MPRIALLSTSDTDLLSARESGAEFTLGNPSRLDVESDLPALITGADLVVVRILGSRRSWDDGFAAVLGAGVPVVVLGGEQTPDADLMELSTVPIGTAAEAHRYLAEGGPTNLAQLHAFLSDTVLLTGAGFEPPVSVPVWGMPERPGADSPASGHKRRDSRDATWENAGGSDQSPGGPRVGVLYYRAHEVSGNSGFAHALADAIDAAGGVGVPIFAGSLRSAPDELFDALGTLDALVVTVLAAGGTTPGTASAGGDDEAWDVERIAALDIPVLQGLCLTWGRDDWSESDDGVNPLDSANQIAIPEFDGRIITAPFSFKEIDADGLPRYVADPERCARVAGIAVAHARLRHVAPADRKIALVLSAYPTKHSRIGNAVGLDTPASTIRLLRRMREDGYDLGPADGPVAKFLDEQAYATDTAAGDALIHALIDAGGQDEEWLTTAQLTESHVRISTEDYLRWTADLPATLRNEMVEAWGEAPGTLFVNDAGEIVLATLQAGNVVLLIQPPRGFGENPVAIYHDPELAPSHHYLAAYRWLAHGFSAHALVHIGKHGSLEWLPGKNAALSADCATDAAIANLPLIYPFLVNDPGEGAQAKRRAHATIVDHLVPPMARAESYGDIARLEQLLDEYGNIAAMDPAKLPSIRAQIWTLMQAAHMHEDLGLEQRPDDEEFDDFLLHVDGWLCEIKDVQIRDGLHVLGQAPDGEARVNLVLAILRASQVWGGQSGAVPGLRRALGLAEGAPTEEVDRVEARARALVEAMEARDWDVAAVPEVLAEMRGAGASGDAGDRGDGLGGDDDEVAQVLGFAAREVVPRLAGTADELDAVMHALDGGFIPAGPSGSPLRGLVNVLPTGRNFYTVDPRAIPSRLAWDTGQAMADSLLERHLEETGSYPASVGLSIWGTSAMRTSGDDIAEVLALLGVRPEWDEASRRVTGLEVIPTEELGRPRVDVTVRISGFFRDAFPHVIAMLDDAVRMVAELDEPDELNYVAAHTRADLAEHHDGRRATTRIFGSAPGSYGAGILQTIEAGNWRDDRDLAEVYTRWGGYAYGRDLAGVPAADDMRINYRRIAVAAKNIDTREHDIADSDDYFQYHGGMIATVRALTGAEPRAYVGDSTTPDAVRTRTLAEETRRVFRARVVNPRWIAAMQRHGYKGAFELAATVDYLFGFDATAGVVQDWMYDTLAREYVLDDKTQDFLRTSNPWALRGMIERLSEAADRGMWAEPDADIMNRMRQVYLDVEGDLEDSHGE
ncbi:cobaltochelatase subunit CobN [Dietzia cinnamea]|uniref:cobaltochelatase subunit CobN n=1 Tax=Dietzia TaxID=37914 RepID=UPI0018DC80A9|nr:MULTISPECIES: cobaltochelatase subunit CobN [Dietzia]MCT2057086.1 cobaltochelatase subunit CobN [Dietzia cinnamea]MCT2097970.1 cobaltochelatase subunit CobN [Dietzia cinnamea]MCT2120853.1 cobaltochelatase subunit CobN [Dietzia cinnamea]MCT2144347.1 cobaltochelatase subunit CobN [Dietzia cinnamea]MCT2303788.1 cobaltochelatase subunit CobN [Dietzia cinnamea]